MEKTEIISIVSAAVLSGLVSTLITIFVQKKLVIKKEKDNIFQTLMSHRYLITDKENVEAINKVEVIFYKDSDVRKAWKDFFNTSTSNPTDPSIINDKYIKLISEIAKSLGYEKIEWDNIKDFYYPQGLATKINEEELLRKAQLAQISSNPQAKNDNSQISFDPRGFQLLAKAIEDPQFLNRFISFAEKESARKGKK